MNQISDANKLSKQKQSVETLRWREGRLEMIDQRVLPMHFEYLAYTNAKEVAEGIRSMVVRGAPAIGCAAAAVSSRQHHTTRISCATAVARGGGAAQAERGHTAAPFIHCQSRS